MSLDLPHLPLPQLFAAGHAYQENGHDAPTGPVELFFGSDTHDGYKLFDRFIDEANQKRPDMLILGGDLVQTGTLEEHRKLDEEVAKFKVPFQALVGNHDYRGTEIQRFEAEFGKGNRSFDVKGVHVIALDDADQTLGDETLSYLEQDLQAHQGQTTIVAMHVPAVFQDPSKSMSLIRRVAGDKVTSTQVKNPAQVKRFTDLMSQYHVDLVVSGHTHVPMDKVVGGVPYVTAGAVGGKLVKPLTNHEYLDIRVDQGKILVRHVGLDDPILSMKGVIANDARYLADQLKTNHPDVLDPDDEGPIPGKQVPTGFQKTLQGAEEEVADGIVLGSAIPALSKLGYKVYGDLTKPKQDSAEVLNLAQVGSRLLRGGQPMQSGFATLKAQGVQTVINLRPEANWEAPMVQAQGMKYVYMPLPAVGAPTNDQAVEFLKTVTDPANGKVFFHCQHGADRTGAMAAAYRIAAEGWPVDKAITEMYQYGFHGGFQDEKLSFVVGFAKYWQALSDSQRREILHRKLNAQA